MYWGSALIDEDWLELACIGMDWPRLADWKIVVERGYRVWNPPSGLGTIPYREIVPRLSRQMSLDWAEIDIGLASDWIGRFSWNCCWLYVVLC